MARSTRHFRQQRAALVEHLSERGIENRRLLDAFRSVPRHRFMDEAFHRRAYNDEALPIGLNQTISQPYTVAHQTSLLDPKREERILEIGTGSGYQAAILCEMGVRVYSVERHRELHRRATRLLRKLGYRVRTHHGDGSRGWAAFAPYDGIIVTAGAEDVPDALLEQLRLPDDHAPGGRLIIPVGDRSEQTMYRITRRGEEEYEYEETTGFRFVPLVEE